MQQDYVYLITIHETGSIKAAAERLHVTQPAVSIALKRVEDALQLQIFNRRTRPLQPTAAGTVLLRYLSKIKNLEELMETELQDMKEKDNGKLTIATTHYITRLFLPPLLATYKEKHPTVSIKLIDESSIRVNGYFSEGGVDVLISPIKIDREDVVCQPIYQEKLLFCIPNRYLPKESIVHYAGQTYGEYLIHHEPAFLDINLLRNIPLITMTEGSSTYRRIQKILESARITPQICQVVDQISTVNALANSGLGAALTAEALVRYTAVSNKVTFFQYDSPNMRRIYYLMYDRSHYISTAVKGFIAVCRQYSSAG